MTDTSEESEYIVPQSREILQTFVKYCGALFSNHFQTWHPYLFSGVLSSCIDRFSLTDPSQKLKKTVEGSIASSLNKYKHYLSLRGDSHMKGAGMLVVLLKGVNFGFWSRIACSGQNTIILSCKGLL